MGWGRGLDWRFRQSCSQKCAGCQERTASPHSKPEPKPGEPWVRVGLSPPGLPEIGDKAPGWSCCPVGFSGWGRGWWTERATASEASSHPEYSEFLAASWANIGS